MKKIIYWQIGFSLLCLAGFLAEYFGLTIARMPKFVSHSSWLPYVYCFFLVALPYFWSSKRTHEKEWFVAGNFAIMIPVLAVLFGYATLRLGATAFMALVTGTLISVLWAAWGYSKIAGFSEWKLITATLAQFLFIFTLALARGGYQFF